MNFKKIKQIISEIVQQQLNESMTLYVKDADYKKLTTLLDISFDLMHILDKIWNKIPEDQQNYFRKNRVSEFVTPDGNDYDKSKGIINLYTSGFTSKFLREYLKECLKRLKELNIQVGKLYKEQSKTYKSEVIRIPILKNIQTYSGPPEVNMSNRNAYHIFHNVLQFNPDDDDASSFHFTTDELKKVVEYVLRQDPDWVDSNQIGTNDYSHENPHDAIAKDIGDKLGGVTMISGGLHREQIRERLERILDVVRWAEKHGHKELYVV